jgi:endonuclease/exonuclease/phosphatase family metal-dependent hydrolase
MRIGTWNVEYANTSLCVAGDYNTDMGTGSYYGTKQGIAALREGLAKCDLYCAIAPETFPIGLLPNPPIDHIFLPVSIQSSTSIAAAWPANKSILSDHSRMIVEVTC